MKLTDTAIRKTKPDAKPYRLYDGRGLYIEMAPSGGNGGDTSTRFREKKNGWHWAPTPM